MCPKHHVCFLQLLPNVLIEAVASDVRAEMVHLVKNRGQWNSGYGLPDF
jgi:hypothetical protein